MGTRAALSSWIFAAVCVVVAIGVTALLTVFLWRPDLLEEAKASVNVIEERPAVSARLEEQYPGETFTVQDRVAMNGERSLSVRLVNSQHAGLELESRKAVAYGVAKFAFTTHPEASELTEVLVQFSTTSTAGPLSWEDNSDPYRFTAEELSGVKAASS